MESKRALTVTLTAEAIDALRDLAEKHGHVTQSGRMVGQGNISKLLEQVASGEEQILLVERPIFGVLQDIAHERGYISTKGANAGKGDVGRMLELIAVRSITVEDLRGEGLSIGKVFAFAWREDYKQHFTLFNDLLTQMQTLAGDMEKLLAQDPRQGHLEPERPVLVET